MSFVINQNREVTGKGYINVLDPETNEVLAFPQTMSKEDIDNAISDNKNGTITQAKPNWYNDKIRPVLEATKMDMFQPKFLGAKVEADATRAFVSSYAKDATFGIIDTAKSGINAESQATHPIATFTGSLAGQTQAILMTAGLGEFFGLGKVANAAKVSALEAGNATVAKAVGGAVSGAGVGALYGAMTKSVSEVNRAIKDNTIPDVVAVGEAALKDSGLFALYGGVGAGIPSKAVGTAAISGLAYTISKVEGASEEDALLNAGIMGLFHLSSSSPKEMDSDLIIGLNRLKYDYIQAKNPAIHKEIAIRAAEEHTLMIEERIKQAKEDYNAKIDEAQIKAMESEGGVVPEIPKKVKVEATPKEIIKDSLEDMLDLKLQDQMTSEGGKQIEPNLKKEASSVISYVKNGEKIYTKITPEELSKLKDEVKNIPQQNNTESQIHLDAITPNLIKIGKEVSRKDFISGHSQAKEVLSGNISKVSSDINNKIKKLNQEEKLNVKQQQEMNSEGGVYKDIVENSFKELTPEEQAKYTPITKKDQLAKAEKVLSSDYEKAKQMALGKETIPGDLNQQVLFNAVKNKALADMDISLLRDLASSPIATSRSLAAQELSASGFDNGLQEADPVRTIESLNKVRKEAVEKKIGKEKVVKEINKEVKDIKKSIKENVKKQDWEGFIKSLEC